MQHTSDNLKIKQEVTYKEQHTLEVLEYYIQNQYERFDHLENKAQQLATISAIVGALVAAFAFTKENISTLEEGLLIIFVASTFFSLAATSWLIRFQNWKTTISLEKLDLLIERQKTITDYNHYQEWSFTYY